MQLDGHISHNEHKRWFEHVSNKLAPTTLTCSKTQMLFGLGSGRTLRSSVAPGDKILELLEIMRKISRNRMIRNLTMHCISFGALCFS